MKLYAVWNQEMRQYLIVNSEPAGFADGSVKVINAQIPNGVPLIPVINSLIATANQLQGLGDASALVGISIDFV